MKNADRIGNVAKQMIGVCNVIINLMEAEENETYDDIFWDELAHTQKLVLEFTKYAFDEQADAEEVGTDVDAEDAEEVGTAEVGVGDEQQESDDDLFSEEDFFGEDDSDTAFDDAFFAGELDYKKGDVTDDDVTTVEKEEENETNSPKGIDK